MTIDHSIKNTFIVTLSFCFLLFIPSLSLAVDDPAATDVSQSPLPAQGKVETFNLEKGKLTIKTSKGERISVFTGSPPVLVGYPSLGEIKKEHGVKIWYTIEGTKKIALKIEKMLDVGC